VDAAVAEVAAQRRLQPAGVAEQEGLVQAVDGAQTLGGGGGHAGVAGHHEVYGVARHQADQAVDDEAHHQQHQQGLQDAAEDEAGHQ